MKRSLSKSWFYFLPILLLLPALLINLGLLTFIDDESIRALVALEMKLSGNLITPTMGGDYYYYKPPLFNWLVLLSYTLTGVIDEWSARITTVVALIGYSGTIYYFTRKHFSQKNAFLVAFLFITCGRVLFWDSMLALIDITFSWVTFTSFMIIYHQFEKGRFWPLFLGSYLLAACGFLMKGLPSIVFQGTTLLTFFIYQKQFKRLFSLAHIVGGLLFLIIIGGYYFVYNQYNDVANVLPSLFNESTKRTAINYEVGKTIIHILSFPFEMVYHFLPWTLFAIFFFTKNSIKSIFENSFIKYCLIIFLANILIYWTSPDVYPRYLLMLAPLIFIVYLHLYQQHKEANTWQIRLLERLFFAVCILISIGSLLPLFLPSMHTTPFLLLKTLGIGLALGSTTYFYFQQSDHRLILLVSFLLIIRLGFNWFILPNRNANDVANKVRTSALALGKQFKGEKLLVYKNTHMNPTNAFYITKERETIVRRQHFGFDSVAVFIINPYVYPEANYKKVGEMELKYGFPPHELGILEKE